MDFSKDFSETTQPIYTPSKKSKSRKTNLLPSFIKKSSTKKSKCKKGYRKKCQCVNTRKLKGTSFNRKRCMSGYHYNKVTGICEPPARFETNLSPYTQPNPSKSNFSVDSIVQKIKSI